MHDALDGREPDPGALELVWGVQALEGAEEVLGVAHVEAGAVVAYEERHAAGGLVRPQLDERRLVPRRELPGVTQQVLEHGARQLRVRPGDEARRDVHDHVARRVPFVQFGDKRGGQRREVDVLEIELVAVEP